MFRSVTATSADVDFPVVWSGEFSTNPVGEWKTIGRMKSAAMKNGNLFKN